MVPLVCGETLQLVNWKVQHVHSANDLQTTLIVIVSSSEPLFLFLNCFKSTFRNPVQLIWVVLFLNIKHNHILRQSFTGLKNPDRAKLYDSWMSRRVGHLCHSGEYTGIGENIEIGHTLFLVTTCGWGKAKVCLYLFTLKGFKVTLSNPADVKLFRSSLSPHIIPRFSAPHFYTLSPGNYKQSYLLHSVQRSVLV